MEKRFSGPHIVAKLRQANALLGGSREEIVLSFKCLVSSWDLVFSLHFVALRMTINWIPSFAGTGRLDKSGFFLTMGH
jgi:hypothetical protein